MIEDKNIVEMSNLYNNQSSDILDEINKNYEAFKDKTYDFISNNENIIFNNTTFQKTKPLEANSQIENTNNQIKMCLFVLFFISSVLIMLFITYNFLFNMKATIDDITIHDPSIKKSVIESIINEDIEKLTNEHQNNKTNLEEFVKHLEKIAF